MQQTDTYKLNLIESGDTFSPAPLNENMEKVEEALLTQADAMDALSSGQLNCITGTYTGSGKFGESDPNTLTFPFEPKLVLVMSETQFCLFARGASKGMGRDNHTSPDDRYIQEVTWNGNTLSWYIDQANSETGSFVLSAAHQMNSGKATYSYLAIG